MSTLKLYTLAYSNSHGKPQSHSMWLPAADLRLKRELDRLKAELMTDALGLAEDDSPAALDCFYEASVAEAPAAPTPNGAQVIERTTARWAVMEGTERRVDGEPEYNLKISVNSIGQAVLDLIHASEDRPDSDLPKISLMVEVNEGLPCVHIYAGASADCAETLFAIPGGKINRRPGDAPHLIEDVHQGYMPSINDVAGECAAILDGTRQSPREG